MEDEIVSIYEHCEDFIYFCQTLKTKANASGFNLLHKIEFEKVANVKQEIDSSLYCFNQITQTKRKNGLTTLIQLLVSYELFINKKEDLVIHIVTNTPNSFIENIKVFISYFNLIFNQDIILEGKKRTTTSLSNSTLTGNNTIIEITNGESGYTIPLFKRTNGTKRIVYFDNLKILNKEKLLGLLETFNSDTFSCIVTNSEGDKLTTGQNCKIIKY